MREKSFVQFEPKFKIKIVEQDDQDQLLRWEIKARMDGGTCMKESGTTT